MSCETKLAEAKAALHQLMLGKSMVSLQYEGRRVQYTAASRTDLETYIKKLEAECGGSSSTGGRGEPFEVTW
jgi:hypothetical protein